MELLNKNVRIKIKDTTVGKEKNLLLPRLCLYTMLCPLRTPDQKAA
jgi:hypothetical protein